jgi:hypothetical protein
MAFVLWIAEPLAATVVILRVLLISVVSQRRVLLHLICSLILSYALCRTQLEFII